MSKEALAKVVQRAISDAAFRRQLSSDPAGALRGFDLTADEASAVRTGDAGRLSALGIDQRVSKAFTLGAAVSAATRIAPSDLSSANTADIDAGSATGSPTIIPHDPEAASTADDDAGASSKSAVIRDDPDGFLAAQANAATTGGHAAARVGDDWKFADRGDAQAARVGDDWKFADRSASQAAPVDGSPEADAAAQSASGGMANYPEHYGLAGPSQLESTRAGDDWARAGSTRLDDSARFGTARLDDDSASSGPSAIRDDPDGLLAAEAARAADVSGVDDHSRVIRDDPDGLLAAAAAREADASRSGPTAIRDDPDGFLAAQARADASGAATPTTDSFIDESSEGYLARVGYDADVTSGKEVTDAHDRTWSGDDMAGPSSSEGTTDSDSGSGTSLAEGDGPNIQP